MTATYTFDVFSSLDGWAAYAPPGDWGGYWGKQGPELEAHRLEQYDGEQRVVLGATTYRDFVEMLGTSDPDSEVHDDWVGRFRSHPLTVVSSTLTEPLDWPDGTVAAGDGVEVVRRLKEESDVPIRSHGSLSLNRALLAAGLVDRLQVTVFPVVCGQTGAMPIWAGAPDLDLELLETRTLDGRSLELTYHPTVRVFD